MMWGCVFNIIDYNYDLIMLNVTLDQKLQDRYMNSNVEMLVWSVYVKCNVFDILKS